MTTSNPSGLAGSLSRQPWLLAAIVGVIAFLVGWMLMGWVIWPVEWVDADVAYLRRDLQEDYVKLVAAQYAADLNIEAAARRIAGLGPKWREILDDVAIKAQGPDQARVQQLKQVIDLLAANNQMPPIARGPGSANPLGNLLLPLVGCLLVVALSLGGGLLYLRSRSAGASAGRPSTRSTGAMPEFVQPTLAPEATAGAPAVAIARFMTTYTLGDDAYDDSFSIDGPDGNFLGECGMGISETIGVGDPKKVTAFEVWLFDKNDIRTVTKVIMSEHAFRDEALKSRLAAKGEPVQAAPGDVITLETATLKVTARVVDMAYGGGALPPSSFFERMTMELQAFRKTAPAAA
ncbi:MAG: hypothetical protein RMK99_12195 [Anaerolineales bacterium]|nr:hypothetical protein [Anaerolineales bacterium]